VAQVKLRTGSVVCAGKAGKIGKIAAGQWVRGNFFCPEAKKIEAQLASVITPAGLLLSSYERGSKGIYRCFNKGEESVYGGSDGYKASRRSPLFYSSLPFPQRAPFVLDTGLGRHETLTYRAPERPAYPVVFLAFLAGANPPVRPLVFFTGKQPAVANSDIFQFAAATHLYYSYGGAVSVVDHSVSLKLSEPSRTLNLNAGS